MMIHRCFHSAKMRFGAVFTALIASFGLSACGYGTNGPVISPGLGAKAVYGLERDSAFERTMSGADREALAVAAGALLNASTSEASRSWRSRSGLSGTIRLGAPYLVGLDSVSGARVPAPLGIDTSTPLVAATGNFVTSKNTNVRLGASTNAMVKQTVPEATILRAYGRTRSGDWILVGVANQILGYAYAELLEAAGGGDPILAGGSARRPQLCRDVWMVGSELGGAQESWSSLACRSDSGSWQVPKERGLI